MFGFDSRFDLGALGMFAIAFVSWISARALENALEDLHISNIDLDQRVGQRTKELAQANLDLEKKAQELADANQLLQGLDKLKSKFVSDVSHELLTPINNLSIYLEMLEEGNPNRAGHYKKILRDETDRLEKLVSNVLDLSRMENQTVELVLKTESLDAII